MKDTKKHLNPSRDPLEYTFDMIPEDEARPLEISEVELPDDPHLDDIVRLALEAYKRQMDILHLIDPDFRSRHLDVAQKYLAEAKDAMYKKERNRIEFEKLRQKQSKKPEKKENSDCTDGSEDVKTYTRAELLSMN